MTKKTKLLTAIAAGAVATLGLSFSTSMAQMGGSHEGHDHANQAKHAKVGKMAPDFTLVDAFGKSHTISDYTKDGKVVVLEWFNSECPIVKRHHVKYSTMTDLAAKYEGKVAWIAINSGAPGKQGHGLDKEAIKNWDMKYPVLNDENGKVGRIYGAKTTPHMFIIDTTGTLVFAGGIDNDRGDEMPFDSKTNYVDNALTEIFAGKTVSDAETKSYGCSVKYAN